MEKIFIIMPAYNEETRIGNTLKCYSDFFNTLRNKKILDYEIIVVINGTTDRTEEIVKNYQKKNKFIKYINLREGGKGFAITNGFKLALKSSSTLIGFVDADMATPPEAFYDLIKNIKNYDGVIASRWMKESKIKKQTLLRIAMSRVFNFFVRALFLMPYKDTQCGAKVFKRKVIEEIIGEIGKITAWAFDIDLLYKARKNGFRIKEIPTIWQDKKESKLDVSRVPIQMFSSIIRLRLLYSLFDFVVRAYNKLPKSLRLHNIYYRKNN